MGYCKTRKSAMEKGRLYYKTGKPCARGHVAPRFTKTRRCVECDRVNKKKRYVDVKLRTPVWADMKAIKAVYNKSRELGSGFTVDHVIPLNGETVSGLHVPENLAIIRAEENFSKQNRIIEDDLY